MAAVRVKGQVPVGSAQWLGVEREQVTQFCEQESEDFAFSARNEVEWLNEHMAEILNNSQLNVTEIFKTPGKLRGKTPRTARKRNLLEIRAPLTDIFATNVVLSNSPSRNTPFNTKLGKLQFAPKDVDANHGAVRLPNVRGKENFDSGYHGMSEDDMDIDKPHEAIPPTMNTRATPPKTVLMQVDSAHVHQLDVGRASEECRTTEGSFHSAREDLTRRDLPPATNQVSHVGPSTHPAEIADADARSCEEHDPEPLAYTSPQRHDENAMDEGKDSIFEEDQELDTAHTPSEGSSPAKPLLRKSSLTFASLPAREPLTTKKSFGARISRTSHVDQPKAAPLNRNSYFGRYTGGKSLGGTRQPEHAEKPDESHAMEIDESSGPYMAQDESDGDGRITKLHNKSSTQRLHERINLLGQTQPGRVQKSIAAATIISIQPAYPELPKASQEEKHPKDHLTEQASTSTNIVAVDDDDDWIKPPSQKSEQHNRPQLAKSRSVDVMEQISGKESVGGNTFGIEPSKQDLRREASPLRSIATHGPPKNSPAHQKSASTATYTSPNKPFSQQTALYKKAVSVSNPGRQDAPSTTPAGTPPKRLHHDGPLNASKSKLQSIMKSARGLFTSTAGVSAQAKMETLSPGIAPLRSQDWQNKGHSIQNPDLGPASLNQMMYPGLPNGSQISISGEPGKAEGRKTRSSTEKEEKQREKEAKDRQRTELRQDSQKSANYKTHAATAEASAEVSKNKTAEVLSHEASKPVRQSPRRQPTRDEAQVPMEVMEPAANSMESSDPVQVMGPPPARSQNQSSQIQKPKEMRRPMKPAKEVAPKPKPQPVAIRVGTLSQRIPLSNAALSSSLQESLPPPQTRQPTVTKKASNASLQTTVSTTSFKSSNSSLASKPKALIAAERKREQDEKEAQRKLEHKREIERKRGAQQEEAQKREQQQRLEAERQKEKERAAAGDDPRKLAQKQAIEKRRLEMNKKTGQKDFQGVANDFAAALQQEKVMPSGPPSQPDLGGGRPASRLNLAQDFPRPPNNYPAPNPAKPPAKRVFEPDHEDEPTRPTRVQGGQSYQQNDTKRRRTEDEETFEAHVRPTMAPPIRQSNIRKDGPKATIFSSSYTTAPSAPSNHAAGPSSMKPSTMNQSYQQHPYYNQSSRPINPMDMAKYTNGKIPFAEAPNPPPPTYKTPLPSKQGMGNAAKSSPLFPNGDKIELEEIATDSEDEDSEDEKEKKRNLPDWVLTPNLDERLRDQERLNPDVLFGPIAPLVMEEIFKDKNRHHRFRSRTSSANWFGSDRLTEEEIRKDNEAREKLRREGGWTFGL